MLMLLFECQGKWILTEKLIFTKYKVYRDGNEVFDTHYRSHEIHNNI